MRNILFILLLIPALVSGQKAVVYDGKLFTYGGKAMTDTVVSSAAADSSLLDPGKGTFDEGT